MRITSLAVGIAIMSFVVGAIGLPVALSGISNNSQPVLVTNGTASPVPVAGSVSVTNLPATQPVSGTVNVGNLPATQTVEGTVAITGVPTVAVQDKQPFHTSVDLSLGNGFSGTISIPDGKRLVVQSLSLITMNAPANNCTGVTFFDNGNWLYSVVPNSSCNAMTSGDALFWSDETQITVQGPGFSSPGSPVFRVTVSGYLV